MLSASEDEFEDYQARWGLGVEDCRRHYCLRQELQNAGGVADLDRLVLALRSRGFKTSRSQVAADLALFERQHAYEVGE